MKAIVFNNDSWHYKVAIFGDSYRMRDLSNICSYTRAFLLGGCMIVLCIAVLAMIAAAAADTLAWLVSGVLFGFVQISGLGSIFPGLLTIVTVIVTTALAVFSYNTLVEKPSVTNSFVVNAYKSWKEKWCAKVVIANTKND